jgi:hypothetical protein
MLDVADQFCERNFPRNNITRIVVDNSLSNKTEVSFSKYAYISGDNTNFEFSGWQSGIDFIMKNYSPSSNDVCILVNDTVHQRNYAIGGDRYFDTFVIRRSSSVWPERWAAGYVDDFPTEASIFGFPVKKWIRSNLIAFNWSCVDLITPLVVPCEENSLFADDISQGFWRVDAPLSPNWKAYISSWLFGDEDPRFPEYRLKWIKHQKLSHENLNFFRKKSVSILSEHYLTVRLLRGGVDIYDFNSFPKPLDRHLTPYYK